MYSYFYLYSATSDIVMYFHSKNGWFKQNISSQININFYTSM